MGRHCRVLIWSEKPAETPLSGINAGQQCYCKKNFQNDKLVSNLLLRFHNKPPRHADVKRIRHDSQETKLCCVENDTKTVNSGVLSPVSIGLIFEFTQLF